MIWKATGMRALLRRIDLSSAAVISALVNFPLDALAVSSCHAADNDLLVGGSGSMWTPRAPAHAMISRVVRGPQFRATARCFAVSFRSNSSGGSHVPLGGITSVNSTDN